MKRRIFMVPQNEVPQTSYTDGAQACVEEIRAMRQRIPYFVIPVSSDANRRINAAASVPQQFVELTAVAVANTGTLVRGGGADAAQPRDLMSYADAYAPVADELEALPHFIRHSPDTAPSQ